MINMIDMHMHLGFASEPKQFASELDVCGVAAFSNTVSVLEYEKLLTAINDMPNIRLGLGMHPWWIKSIDETLMKDTLFQFEKLLQHTRYVGEIGLDFWETHINTKQEQIALFTHIVELCAHQKNKLISIHAVKSEKEVLDIVIQNHCLDNNVCIMHSYGGSSEELLRAINSNMYFSVGKRMLASKRGKEYVRIIPLSQILIESDLPASLKDNCSAQTIESSLSNTLTAISELKNIDVDELKATVLQTSKRLLQL